MYRFMRHRLPLYLGICPPLLAGLLACGRTVTRPVSSVGSALQPTDSLITIFLLERDRPVQMQRLGVVSIVPPDPSPYRMDNSVKQQLRQDCERLGTNGAYRINDGPYSLLVNWF